MLAEIAFDATLYKENTKGVVLADGYGISTKNRGELSVFEDNIVKAVTQPIRKINPRDIKRVKRDLEGMTEDVKETRCNLTIYTKNNEEYIPTTINMVGRILDNRQVFLVNSADNILYDITKNDQTGEFMLIQEKDDTNKSILTEDQHELKTQTETVPSQFTPVLKIQP